MSDEQPPRPPERPFTTIPERPPIREVTTRGASTAEIEMKQAAREVGQARLVELRSAARRDAAIVVSRARQRAGVERANWSAHDADVMHVITDLLIQVQTQTPSKQDPVFDNGA